MDITTARHDRPWSPVWSCLFAGPASPVVVNIGLDVDERQSLGPSSGIDVKMDVNLGNRRGSASTGLSDEGLARTLSVDPP